jgi:hypothetical protein
MFTKTNTILIAIIVVSIFTSCSRHKYKTSNCSADISFTCDCDGECNKKNDISRLLKETK